MENRITKADSIYAACIRRPDGQVFLWHYRSENEVEACLHVRCTAAEPDTSLTHEDADAIIKRIRDMAVRR